MSLKDKETDWKRERGDRSGLDKNNDFVKMRRKNKKHHLECDEKKSSASTAPRSPKTHRSPMKRNIAQNRLKRLRSKLDTEIKMKEKLENVDMKHLVHKSVVKIDEAVAQKLKQYKIPKSDTQVPSSSKKNFAGDRLKKLKKELQTVVKSKDSSTKTVSTPVKNSLEENIFTTKDTLEDKDMLMEVDVDMSETDEKAFAVIPSLINKKIPISQNFSISPNAEIEDYEMVSFVNDEISKIREEPSYMALHKNFVSDVEMNFDVPVGDLYIVVDTNIFLSHLKLLNYLIKHSLPPFDSHVLVVPWPVIQEIDYAMKKTNQKLASQARYANNFINDCLKKKDLRFFGQSLADFKENFKNTVNIDDFILQYCMKFAALDNNVVLLTDDKNLCSKAIINQLRVYNKEEFQKAFNISKHL